MIQHIVLKLDQWVLLKHNHFWKFFSLLSVDILEIITKASVVFLLIVNCLISFGMSSDTVFMFIYFRYIYIYINHFIQLRYYDSFFSKVIAFIWFGEPDTKERTSIKRKSDIPTKANVFSFRGWHGVIGFNYVGSTWRFR